ncbi:hypothetical protein DCWBC2_0267 [Dehalococcoides mccartyi]|nr:hypothetical protein DCWBC2_0267 [Dehalococcoides mccartyi]
MFGDESRAKVVPAAVGLDGILRNAERVGDSGIAFALAA